MPFIVGATLQELRAIPAASLDIILMRLGDFAEWYPDPLAQWEGDQRLRDFARVVRAKGYDEKTMRYIGIVGLAIREFHRILRPSGHAIVECDKPTMPDVATVFDLIFGSRHRGETVTWRHIHLPRVDGMRGFGEGERFILRYVKTDDAKFQIFNQPARAEYIDKNFRKIRAKELAELPMPEEPVPDTGFWLDESPPVQPATPPPMACGGYRWQSMTTNATRARYDLTQPWRVALPDGRTWIHDPAANGCSWDDIPNDDPRFAKLDQHLVAGWTIQQKFDYLLLIGHIHLAKSFPAVWNDGTVYEKGGEPSILQPVDKALKGLVTTCIWDQKSWTQGDVDGRPDDTIDEDVRDFAGCVARYMRAIEGQQVLLVLCGGRVGAPTARVSNSTDADVATVRAAEVGGRDVIVIGHYDLLKALGGPKTVSTVWRPRTLPDVRAYKDFLGPSYAGRKEFEGYMLDVLGTSRNHRRGTDEGTDCQVTCRGLKVDIQATAMRKPSATHFKSHVADTDQHLADIGLYYTVDERETTPTKRRFEDSPRHASRRHFTIREALEGKTPPIDGWDERIDGWVDDPVSAVGQ